jgi:hypothetical protein
LEYIPKILAALHVTAKSFHPAFVPSISNSRRNAINQRRIIIGARELLTRFETGHF